MKITRSGTCEEKPWRGKTLIRYGLTKSLNNRTSVNKSELHLCTC